MRFKNLLPHLLRGKRPSIFSMTHTTLQTVQNLLNASICQTCHVPPHNPSMQKILPRISHNTEKPTTKCFLQESRRVSQKTWHLSLKEEQESTRRGTVEASGSMGSPKSSLRSEGKGCLLEDSAPTCDLLIVTCTWDECCLCVSMENIGSAPFPPENAPTSYSLDIHMILWWPF